MEQANTVTKNVVAVPGVIKALSWIMVVAGVLLIIVGLPILLLLGLGIVYIIVGVLVIRYGRAVLKLQSATFKHALIVLGASTALILLAWWINDFKLIDEFEIGTMVASAVSIGLLFAHKNKFTN